MVVYDFTPALRMQRYADLCEVQASLVSTVRPCLKNQTNRQTKNKEEENCKELEYNKY